MLQTKQNIELLKQEAKQRLEELQNEELNLKEDVTAYEDKFAEWEKPILNTNFPVQKRISTSANNLCQVVIIEKCAYLRFHSKFFVGSERFFVFCCEKWWSRKWLACR